MGRRRGAGVVKAFKLEIYFASHVHGTIEPEQPYSTPRKCATAVVLFSHTMLGFTVTKVKTNIQNPPKSPSLPNQPPNPFGQRERSSFPNSKSIHADTGAARI